MYNCLIRKFVPDSRHPERSDVRLAYGTLSSGTGIIVNLLLFAVKLGVAVSLHSFSVVSDAFNNLTDCLSNVLALAGFRLADKPADREHPYGHGRMEYVVGFALTLAVIMVGLQLLGNGIRHILQPEPALASGGMLVILGVTAAMKLWLSSFNSRIADCTDNVAVRASALDARSDALVTLMTIAALLLEQTGSCLPFDGLAGLLVSLFILRSGVSMGRDVINRILGQPLPQEDRDHIVRILREEPEILSVHDLEVHDYGPARRMGSVHAEVRADMSLLEAHRAVDRAEQRIMDELGIRMTIHADPYVGTDPRTLKYRQLVQKELQAMDSGLAYHDLRLDDKEEPPVLSFDVVIPYGCSLGTEEITEQLRDALAADDIQLMITFDSGDPNEKTDHLAYK